MLTKKPRDRKPCPLNAGATTRLHTMRVYASPQRCLLDPSGYSAVPSGPTPLPHMTWTLDHSPLELDDLEASATTLRIHKKEVREVSKRRKHRCQQVASKIWPLSNHGNGTVVPRSIFFSGIEQEHFKSNQRGSERRSRDEPL